MPGIPEACLSSPAEVAQRIAPLIGPNDLVTRFRGDEYAILRFGAGLEAAQHFARGVIETLGEPYELEGHRTIVGASVGIAVMKTRTPRRRRS